MHNKPFFSIVTVSFNSEATLESTIFSVCRQRRELFEYILVDGLSTDSTLAVAQKHKPLFDHIVSEPDANMYDGLNKGILLAKGEFIIILNSDDELQDGCLESMKAYIDGNFGYECYVGLTEVFSRRGGQPKMRVQRRAIPVWAGMPFDHQACIFKRDVYSRLGQFDIDYPLVADYDFILRALKSGISFKLTPIKFNKFFRGGRSNFFVSAADIYRVLRRHSYSPLVALSGVIFRAFVFSVGECRRILAALLRRSHD